MPTIDVKAEISGSVWKVEAGIGDALGEDDPILVLESMKMEIPVVAPRPGRLASVLVKEGDMVAEGQTVATLDT